MKKEEIIEELVKNNIKLGYEFSFPRYNILPDEVRLAMKVLENYGMKVKITINEEK